MTTTDTAAAAGLLSAAAVRSRCRLVYESGLAGRLPHFALSPDSLGAAADYVAGTIRLNYPALKVPFHARWRHFVVGGADRWAALARTLDADGAERARIRFDLAVTSVLLDAGAGPDWRWREPGTGHVAVRSEGLALASLEAFRQGLLSCDPRRPLRADAAALQRLEPSALGAAFQVSASNPLVGMEGRAGLLRRLGDAISATPALFAGTGRVGGLFDVLAERARGGRLPAPAILTLVLKALGPIWPGRIVLGGVNLGDTWRHPAIVTTDASSGLVPFHKLSQWLSYSLIEPLQEAGIEVTDIDGLTGLAEYRNGGLFLDLGVIAPRDPGLLARAHAPGEEPIVEWRALTVALLDEIAPLVRARLGLSAAEMPLAAVLEGGTWSAGRRIARELRPDGGPPIPIVSDGSVF